MLQKKTQTKQAAQNTDWTNAMAKSLIVIMSFFLEHLLLAQICSFNHSPPTFLVSMDIFLHSHSYRKHVPEVWSHRTECFTGLNASQDWMLHRTECSFSQNSVILPYSLSLLMMPQNVQKYLRVTGCILKYALWSIQRAICISEEHVYVHKPSFEDTSQLGL